MDKLAVIDNDLRTEIHKLMAGKGSAFLFGSRARGDNRSDSDWDILVLINRDGRSSWDDYNAIGYPLNELFWNRDQDVNTIIQTTSEWRQKSFTPFYKNVMLEAVEI